MRFFSTIDSERVNAIWNKFDLFLVKEFKEANPSLSDEEILEATKDGKLTIKYQEDQNYDVLVYETANLKLEESEEYLVTNFGTESDIADLESWKAAN
jgi:hypothetical protein